MGIQHVIMGGGGNSLYGLEVGGLLGGVFNVRSASWEPLCRFWRCPCLMFLSLGHGRNILIVNYSITLEFVRRYGLFNVASTTFLVWCGIFANLNSNSLNEQILRCFVMQFVILHRVGGGCFDSHVQHIWVCGGT